ncbi:hypothetical protein VPH35_113423 [Triticum aestivum]
MAAASYKHRKDVAELEHGLEHKGDICLLPASTARSYACPRSRRARRIQCAPITCTGRSRLAAAAYCPAPLRPQPQCSTSMPPCCCVSLKPPPHRSSAGLLTVPPQPPQPPRRAAHLHRLTHGPEHRAAAGELRHRRHTSNKENDAQDKPAHDTTVVAKPG